MPSADYLSGSRLLNPAFRSGRPGQALLNLLAPAWPARHGVRLGIGQDGIVSANGLEKAIPAAKPRALAKNPYRYFKMSPEIIQLGVMMYVRFPLSLRNVEDLLHERGIDVCCESIRRWVDRFGTYFASKIRKRRSEAMRQVPQWRWHLDEVFVTIRGETHYLWRAVDHEGEVLEVYVTKKRHKAAALKFLRKAMARYRISSVPVEA